MTRVAIAGGHGQIALHLTRLLTADGLAGGGAGEVVVRSIIRDPEQSADVRAAGGEPVLLDMEAASAEEVAEAIGGCDAVVFAAGAGPGSGAARKETVDHGAAVRLIEACRAAGVDRYLMISAMGTDDPPSGDGVFEVYLRAKARADRALMDSGLSWTIIRPGRLTDDEPTGRVQLARHVPAGEVPRADVAAVLAACLAAQATAGTVAELVRGDVDVAQAVGVLAAG